jgi:hypothetical protein
VKDSHRHRQWLNSKHFEARVRVQESVRRRRALAAAVQVLAAAVEHTLQAAQQVLVGAGTTGGGPGEVVQGNLPVPLPSVQAVQPRRQSCWHRWASFEHRLPQVESAGTQPGIGPLLTVTAKSLGVCKLLLQVG